MKVMGSYNKEFNIYKNSKRSIIDIKDVVNLVKYCIGKIKCETLYINGIEIISIVDLVDKIAYIEGKYEEIISTQMTLLRQIKSLF